MEAVRKIFIYASMFALAVLISYSFVAFFYGNQVASDTQSEYEQLIKGEAFSRLLLGTNMRPKEGDHIPLPHYFELIEIDSELEIVSTIEIPDGYTAVEASYSPNNDERILVNLCDVETELCSITIYDSSEDTFTTLLGDETTDYVNPNWLTEDKIVFQHKSPGESYFRVSTATVGADGVSAPTVEDSLENCFFLSSNKAGEAVVACRDENIIYTFYLLRNSTEGVEIETLAQDVDAVVVDVAVTAGGEALSVASSQATSHSPILRNISTGEFMTDGISGVAAIQGNTDFLVGTTSSAPNNVFVLDLSGEGLLRKIETGVEANYIFDAI